MASNSRDWSAPAPIRALLWWPGVSFVLVILSPATVEATIVAAGVLLAVIGGFVSAAHARLLEHGAQTADAPTILTSAAAVVTDVAATAALAPDLPSVARDPLADPRTGDVPTLEISPLPVPAGQPA